MTDKEHLEKVTLLQLRVHFNALASLSAEYYDLVQEAHDNLLITQKSINNKFRQLDNQKKRVSDAIDVFCKNSDQSQNSAVKSLLDRFKNHFQTWHTIEAKIDSYLKQGSKKGAALANLKKSKKKSRRQKLITEYLTRNPNPDIKNISFEAHLVKNLRLKVSEKTINNDLKKLGLITLKRKLEKR